MIMCKKWEARVPGITILEIIFGLLIIGILIGFIAPRVNRALQNAKITTGRVQIQELATKLEAFASDVGSYPVTLTDLVVQPSGAANWRGYAKERDLKDPWNREFQYQLTPGSTKAYELFSWGPEGETGPETSRLRAE